MHAVASGKKAIFAGAHFSAIITLHTWVAKASHVWGRRFKVRVQVSNQPQKSSDRIEARRQFLKLGAAGLPMVITARAGAQQAVISQLRCAITLQSRMRILVDQNGAAWAGSRNVNLNRNNSITRFKNQADFVYPNDTVPSGYRPTGNDDYSLYLYSRGLEINPDQHLDGNYNWNYQSNEEGLYVALSVYYAENQGNNGAWPGISCIVSILTYINMQ